MKRLEYIVLLFTPCIILALEPSDVLHNTTSLFYVNPVVGQFKIRIKQGAATQAFVIVNTTPHTMRLGYTDGDFNYFVANVSPFDTTARYYFIIKNTDDSLRYPMVDGLKPASTLFHVPDWAKGKMYYSIFVDGFSNGEVTNDPEEQAVWSDKPKDWTAYGGDLQGIIQNIAYIESIGADVVMLQPIFSANSNHKFNPSSYATVDPAFGDTIILKNLINELHALNKKVVLSVILTHTGTDFPIFADIINNGRNSKYTRWYTIKSYPVQTSPPNYDCWRSDGRFPKLNLQNTQAVSFLIGHLEFWKHFGFDGFYIGESKTIQASFVQKLRTQFKSKYPDCLLLGCDMRLINGQGFDGCSNDTLRQLIVSYFIKKTIATSDFDRILNRLLFFNPPQANMCNLINLSTFDMRISLEQNTDLSRIIYAFAFTCVGSPVVLYGDEVGLSDYVPLNLGSFPWDRANQNRELMEEIKKLAEIRKSNPQIGTSHFYTLYINDITRVYAYDRGGLITVINSGDVQSYVELPAWDGTYLDVISGQKLTVYSQQLRLSVAPMSYRILRREF